MTGPATSAPAVALAASRPRFGLGFWVEVLFALAVIGLLVRAYILFRANGYLPQPFFFEPSDTLMDWFNTAYWARDPGAYDSWRTIYPPLTFVVLRVLGVDRCYDFAASLTSRDCDWLGVVSILVSFVINIVLILRVFWKIDPTTAVQRTVGLALGLPMVYALERGNVLLLAFTCFLLAIGPLLRSVWAKWLFAGLAVNFKVYLVAPFAVMLLKRKWRFVEGVALSTLAIYIITYGIYGGGSPLEIYSNISDYSSGFVASQVTDLWYSSTYQPLISLLRGEVFSVSTVIGSSLPEIGVIVLPVFILLGQLSIVAACAATYLRPEAVTTHRVAALGVCLALITSEAGAYTQIMLILLVFMERWKGIAAPIAIVLSYILCLPGDFVISAQPALMRDSWLAGQLVVVDLGLGVGMILRPGLVIGIGIALSMQTILAVWTDIRGQGWKHRWRYRDDQPLLPGVEKPDHVSANSR